MPGNDGSFQRLAEFFSIIFHPAVVSPVILIFFTLKIKYSGLFEYDLIVPFFIFMLVWPLCWLLILSDKPGFDVSFSKRPIFLGMNFLGVSFLEIYLYFKKAPYIFQSVTISIIFIAITLICITFFWKISIHLSTMGAGLAFLVYWFGFKAWIGFLTLPLLFWARIYLKKHTFWQALAGLLISWIVVLIVFELL